MLGFVLEDASDCLVFARVLARATHKASDLLHRPALNLQSTRLNASPNAAAGASACFSCSVGHYANASGDWRRLSTVTVDGLLIDAARLGGQMAVPRFHGTGSTTG